jgi:hypothetical protein
LLTSLYEAGAEEQAAVLARRISAVFVDRNTLEDLKALVEDLWESGGKEQATAVAYRALTCAGPHDPEASVLVAKMLDETEAEEFSFALLSRCSIEDADLAQPSAVVELLRALQDAGAEEDIDALLARDFGMSVACHDPEGVADLLRILGELNAEEQIATLIDRNPAALVELDDSLFLASLLKAASEAGATDQVTILAQRAAKGGGNLASGSRPLIGALRYVGAESEAIALKKRLPGEECFESFLAVGRNAVDYRFGLEPDGTPAKPWGWDDLGLSGSASSLCQVCRPASKASRPSGMRSTFNYPP